jgi:hypothetical protein
MKGFLFFLFIHNDHNEHLNLRSCMFHGAQVVGVVTFRGILSPFLAGRANQNMSISMNVIGGYD